MNALKTMVGVAGLAIAAQAAAQITFYELENFDGRSFTADRPIGNFERFGFNDRASSVIVDRGRWEVCEDARFSGRCVLLRPGNYDSLRAMGLNNRISSVRAVTGSARYADAQPRPAYGPAYVQDYGRRNGERFYEANVTSVRAVVGPPEQRCWVEREQVVQDNPGGVNVPGAIAGAVIGGILGHQIGGGRGKDVATAGGAVGGAALGANIGRGGGQQVYSQDVQRCAYVADNRQPEYWDVTYTFRGVEHRMQMSFPPGATITVNEHGEPRV